MTRYAVALGSNLGDRVGHLRAAVEQMSRWAGSYRTSGLYETAPVGGPGQDPYLNAVVVAESSLGPEELLRRLHDIEASRGREREVRWGPRTLDLDIVAMGPGSHASPGLEIPHPRAAERRFVLEPLCDVWPDALVGEGLTAREAKDRVVDQEVDLLTRDWLGGGRPPGRYWVAGQLLIFAALVVALVMDGSLPGTTYGLVTGDSVDGWRIAGGVLLLMGIVGVLTSARSLGRAMTPMPEPVVGAALVESGLYAWVRHPVYGAVFLVSLGASLLFASTSANVLSLGLFGFFWVKSSYEERMLRIAYAGYSAYRRRVRRRFLPFLI
jgi:2-amino-4-hydroxy-6-hydroxymethyldihydropteridine diphosphokinase